MIEHTRDGEVHRLAMRDGENLLNPDFFRALHEQLDAVEAQSQENAALVLTGEGKYFSNGLNLPVVGKPEGDEGAAFGRELMRRDGDCGRT